MLHYTIQGTGTPLLLLHGNGEDSTYFQHQIPVFAEQYQVIAIDTRGHGASPRGDEPFTLDQFVKDLYRLTQELHLPPFHLLGFSDGANIAMLFALRHPEQILKLILNGGNRKPSGVKWTVQLPILLGYLLTACFQPISTDAKRNHELLRLMVKEPHISLESLETLTMPVLVIAGTKDMIRDSHTREIAAHLPNSTLCILPGDHFLAAKSPDAFNNTVLTFLN